MHVRFEKRVEAAGGDVRQHQRASAHIFHCSASLVQASLQCEVRLQRVTRHIADANERVIEPIARRNVDARAVAPRPATLHGPEKLVERRVVNGADLSLASANEGDGDAPVAHAVNEIDGAVNRIDEPYVPAYFSAGFLAKHVVAGELSLQALANHRLDCVIGRTYEILWALCLGHEFDLAPEVAAGQCTCVARELPRNLRTRRDVGRGHAANVPQPSTARLARPAGLFTLSFPG